MMKELKRFEGTTVDIAEVEKVVFEIEGIENDEESSIFYNLDENLENGNFAYYTWNEETQEHEGSIEIDFEVIDKEGTIVEINYIIAL